MKDKKVVPPRNYLILIIAVIFTVGAVFYFLEWQQNKEDLLTSESYLISNNTVSLTLNTLEELETTLLESPSDLFVFTGYTGDIEEYYLEEDLKEIIDNYNLNDNFYYLNVTDLMDDENFTNELSSVLGIEIDSLPIIIYVSDDNAINKVSSSGDYLKASDFEKLLEIYEFKESK